jgi:hypothetical protein
MEQTMYNHKVPASELMKGERIVLAPGKTVTATGDPFEYGDGWAINTEPDGGIMRLPDVVTVESDD